MSPDYFFDSKYISPHGFQGFEYSRLDSSNSVDLSVFFDQSLVDYGLISDDGLAMIDRFRRVPVRYEQRPELPLEFDCGTSTPGVFLKLCQRNVGSVETVRELAKIVNADIDTLPDLPFPLYIEDVGIMPSRGIPLLRFMVRGPHKTMKEFVTHHGCRNTEVFDTSEYPICNTAINFDWDGTTMSNFTFHSPNIHHDHPWIKERTLEATAKISDLYKNIDYRVVRHVKVGLSPTFHDDYLKVYFTVRYKSSV